MNRRVTADALEAAAHLTEARTERAIRQAVDRFVAGLGVVPDARPGELSDDEVRQIEAVAESVIDQIEARVDRMPAGSARRLVSAVYEIRRLLEELDRWKRHFGSAVVSVHAR